MRLPRRIVLLSLTRTARATSDRRAQSRVTGVTMKVCTESSVGSARRLPFETRGVSWTAACERLSWRGAIAWRLARRVIRWSGGCRSRSRLTPLVQRALHKPEARHAAQEKCDDEEYSEDGLPHAPRLFGPSLRAIAADRPWSLRHASPSPDRTQRLHAIASGTRLVRRLTTTERGLSAPHLAPRSARCREARIIWRTIDSPPPGRPFAVRRVELPSRYGNVCQTRSPVSANAPCT